MARLFFCLAPLGAHAFGLNDVSVLLPLPRTDAEATYLLKGADVLPREILKKIPRLVTNDSQPEGRLNSLRVLAFRFDPCFFDGLGPVVCRRQVRLVLQPLSKSGANFLAFDAAVHAFFEFDEREWSEVMEAWVTTTVDVPTSALQVHPRIRSEGLDGAHWARLKSLLVKFCDPAHLVRVTTSTVNAFGTQWNFSGFDLKNGQRKMMEIARVGKNEQSFFGDLGSLKEFFGDVIPKPAANADWIEFLQHSVGARNTMAPERLERIGVEAIEIENPQMANPGTIDCVSCHVAQNVRFWTEANVRGFKQSQFAKESWFTSRWNLRNTTSDPFYTNRVRAFGYFVFDPVVTQRVINETAAAAELLSR